MSDNEDAGRAVTVATPGGAYDVLIGTGLLGGLGTLLARHAPAHRYAVIADDRVAGLYGDAVVQRAASGAARVDLFTFPAGESQKSRESWSDLSDRMLAAGMGRDAAVIALGGGVTGDLAGFVAATYMRGLPVVQIPTTLLAMIDSSVGGKTGVDTPGGKNLIGAFLQPRLVIADTEVLATLPAPELRAGLAEAIKHGAIADEPYLSRIESDLEQILSYRADSLAWLVHRSVEIKAEVVGRDERESGPRKMLNFGHTIGHAVEALSGYRMLHGEAISVGMVAEAAIGERIGVTRPGSREYLERVLTAAGLPTRVPDGMGADRIVEATRTDKKAREGRVEFALIERIGAASPGEGERWAWAVDDDPVRSVLREQR